MLIDFDKIRGWYDAMYLMVKELLPSNIQKILASKEPESVEDSCDIVFEHADRSAVIDAVLGWLRSGTIVAFHGTRLTDEELACVREIGLIPLDANARNVRLTRALSMHPQWQSVADRLDKALGHELIKGIPSGGQP